MKSLVAVLFALFVCLTQIRAQNAYLDSSFHYTGIQDSITNGTTLFERRGYVLKQALQPDGKIVALVSRNTVPGVNVTRLLPNGNKDVSFGINGQFNFTHGAGTYLGVTHDMALQPDGKIVVLGTKGASGSKDTSFLLRIKTDGILDTAFGQNGIVTMVPVGIPSANRNPRVYGVRVFVRPNGKIAVVTQRFIAYGTETLPLIYQYQSNGQPDSSFGTNGSQLASLPANVENLGVTGAALDGNGNLVLCGAGTDPQLNTLVFFTRFSASGVPDPGLGTAGWAFTNIPPYTGLLYVRGMVLQSDGKAIVGVNVRQSLKVDTPMLVRFHTNGTLDTSYGSQGIARRHRTQGTSENDPIEDLALLPNDSLLVGITLDRRGIYPKENLSLMKLDPNGKLATHWGNGGFIELDFKGSRDQVRSILVQPDGKILVGGGFSEEVNSTPYTMPVLVRFKDNRSLLPQRISVPIPKVPAFWVYPNPCVETAIIEGSAPAQLAVINGLGQFVQEVSLKESNGFRATLSRLPAGTYFIKSTSATDNQKPEILIAR